MPSGGVVVRAVEHDEVTPAFLAEAVRLLDHAFGGWPPVATPVPAQDHLRWKMSGTVPGLPAALIATEDGVMVAFRTVQARRLLLNGEWKLFIHFVDAAVDPERQGRGINRAVQSVMQEDYHPRYDISIDDSANETIVRGRTRLGVIRPFGNAIRPYLLPLDSARLFRDRSLPLHVPGAIAAAAARLASGSARLRGLVDRHSPVACSVRTVDYFDRRFDDLTSAALRQFDLVGERSTTYLNWRYADPRAGDFVIRVAERGEQLLGYAVTKAEAETANIADLLVAEGQTGVADALVSDAVELARTAGSAGVICWLPERHPHRAALRRAGFVSFTRRTPLVYRGVSMTDEELAFLRRRSTPLHLMRGDTDMI